MIEPNFSHGLLGTSKILTVGSRARSVASACDEPQPFTTAWRPVDLPQTLACCREVLCNADTVTDRTGHIFETSGPYALYGHNEDLL
jgi:hypothetical protein